MSEAVRYPHVVDDRPDVGLVEPEEIDAQIGCVGIELDRDRLKVERVAKSIVVVDAGSRGAAGTFLAAN